MNLNSWNALEEIAKPVIQLPPHTGPQVFKVRFYDGPSDLKPIFEANL